MKHTMPGGISPAQFMRRHWQKSPLLIRQAIAGFAGVLTRKQLFALAARDDVESRLVLRGENAGKWSLEHGPFRAADLKSLPATNWTLLVQGVDQHVEAAARLLGSFDFIPYARLDDLMISYAVPGGGVGPHFDSYDVFLLQGPGRRRWRVSTQDDLRLQPGLPLKILARFRAGESWDLDPGDMLYLPPSVAHDGIALSECMTCSIGFRAPAARELVERFLQYLPDVIDVRDERYADPDLRATTRPARIDARMQARLRRMLDPIRWDRALVDRFAGCMLSEPVANVVFEPPQPPLSWRAFARKVAAGAKLRLDRRARMLYDSARVYLNGEEIADTGAHPALAMLADRRELTHAPALSEATLRLLYDGYLSGAVRLAVDER